MTEPSRQAPARRRRAMLAITRELDERYGADQSEVVFTYDDGWTIKRVTRLEDQLREGELMHNCLRELWQPCDNLWSLRDIYNLPHTCFSAWRVGADDDLDEIPERFGVGHLITTFITGTVALLMVDRNRPLKDEHAARLRIFANDEAAAVAEVFPSDTATRLRVCANALDPTFAVHVDNGDRIVLLP